MREIKFRGLNAKGQWEYGYVVREQFTAYDMDHYLECVGKNFLEYEDINLTSTKKETIAYGYKIHRDGHQSSVWVDKKTVGQFVGYADTKEHEIFEGDIVKCVALSNDHHQKGAITISPIEYFVTGFTLAITYVPIFPFCVDHDIEVIGNIYENIDLIPQWFLDREKE
jgi:uncharacterized phage protein (TIGR01671 family)